ncbi:MAG: sigma 54-interacting transcriptional regulator [Myxococcaceae bacterium]
MSTHEPETSTLGKTATVSRVQPVRLLVIEGVDEGKQAIITEGTAVVGSTEGVTLRLSDDAVSRRHLAVELLGTKVRVKDLGSKNGTRYLGNRIEALELPLGATIELGKTRLALLPSVTQGRLSDKEELAGLLGRSVAMKRLFAQLEQVAPTDAAVLIHGETGAGKEGVARAIHALSPRAQGPFIVFDCGAVAPDLIQAQLFGHVKGAFTSAVKDTAGALERADGGVLFLDEIAELPLTLQPSLLRALESRTFSRVGEGLVRKSDFRVLAATHHDLAARAKSGAFRMDLYFRIAALVLEVPPLSSRPDDVPMLAHAFAANAGATAPLAASTLAALAARQWPGNVRELKNAVERVLALGASSLMPGAKDEALDFHGSREQALKAFERSYLEALLARHDGNASAAAREAGIARSYLYKMLEAHGLKR